MMKLESPQVTTKVYNSTRSLRSGNSPAKSENDNQSLIQRQTTNLTATNPQNVDKNILGELYTDRDPYEHLRNNVEHFEEENESILERVKFEVKRDRRRNRSWLEDISSDDCVENATVFEFMKY